MAKKEPKLSEIDVVNKTQLRMLIAKMSKYGVNRISSAALDKLADIINRNVADKLVEPVYLNFEFRSYYITCDPYSIYFILQSVHYTETQNIHLILFQHMDFQNMEENLRHIRRPVFRQ